MTIDAHQQGRRVTTNEQIRGTEKHARILSLCVRPLALRERRAVAERSVFQCAANASRSADIARPFWIILDFSIVFRSRRKSINVSDFSTFFLVLPDRIELSTSPLPRECSTTELRQRILRHRGHKRGGGVRRGEPATRAAAAQGARLRHVPHGGSCPCTGFMHSRKRCWPPQDRACR
jgi:hypothetical protein